VLTYDVPHQKTYDLLSLLHAKGYRQVQVFGTALHYEKRFQPLIEHRPELSTEIEPIELCRNLGYWYKKTTYDEIDLEKGTIVLIAGAGLLPQEFVNQHRIINAHPGYLPNCRGLDALKWAIYEGQPIGVTTHLIGKEVDAGEIIERKEIPVYPNDTFHRVCDRVYQNEIKMLVSAISKIDEEHKYVSGKDYVIHKRMPKEKEKELLARFEKRKSNETMD